MACTRTSRPDGRYYVFLALSIVILAVLISTSVYLADTRTQLSTLALTVDKQGTRLSAIPDFIYDIDVDMNIYPAAGAETSPAAESKKTAASSFQHDVLLRTCVAREYADKSTISVSSSLAHLVGREVFIAEINRNATVSRIDADLGFPPAARICVDDRTAARLDNKRIILRVVK